MKREIIKNDAPKNMKWKSQHRLNVRGEKMEDLVIRSIAGKEREPLQRDRGQPERVNGGTHSSPVLVRHE